MKQTKKQIKYYFIGIKGVGMTMLAQFLQEQGNLISGSDISDSFLTDRVLKKAGIKVFSPFSGDNIPHDRQRIIYSSAYSAKNNVEMKFITQHPERFQKVEILSYAEAMGSVFNQYKGLAVCGSHGKTSTSAYLAYVLWKSGLDPNALVGSRVPQLKGSSLSGRSKYLLAEVDEYQNKLQYFKPWGVILNNIDYDHPDYYKTKSAYLKAFSDFIKKIPTAGFLVINGRDKNIKKIKKFCRAKIISYDLVSGSFGQGSDYLAYNWQVKTNYQSFNLSYQGKDLGKFKIKLKGDHNILNALAVIATAYHLGVSLDDIRSHLFSFRGVERRLQTLGYYHGAIIIDDYAHHPTEIKSTLIGLRRVYPKKRIITVFHPHTFTRTKALFKDFVTSFSQTDELLLLDIYSSAREKEGGVSSNDLSQAIRKFNQQHKIKQSVCYLASRERVLNYLRKEAHSDDIVLLMGAGDVFRIAQDLLKKK